MNLVIKVEELEKLIRRITREKLRSEYSSLDEIGGIELAERITGIEEYLK